MSDQDYILATILDAMHLEEPIPEIALHSPEKVQKVETSPQILPSKIDKIFHKKTEGIDKMFLNQTTEIEAAFGSWKGETFYPDILSKSLFGNLKELLFNESSVDHSFNKTEVHSIKSQPLIRKIIDLNSGNISYQKKHRFSSIDDKTWGIRVSESKEEFVDEKQWNSSYRSASKNNYDFIRIRDRDTFKPSRKSRFYGVIIELTCVKEITDNGIYSKLEVEIERTNTKIQGSEFRRIVSEIYSMTFDLIPSTIPVSSLTERIHGVKIFNSLFDADFKNPLKLQSNFWSKPVNLKVRDMLNPHFDPAVTLKMDGLRLFFLVGNNATYLVKPPYDIHVVGQGSSELYGTLIDGEFLDENKAYYSFDILFRTRLDVRSENLESRLTILKELSEFLLNDIKWINKKFFTNLLEDEPSEPSEPVIPEKEIHKSLAHAIKKNKAFGKARKPSILRGLEMTGYSRKDAIHVLRSDNLEEIKDAISALKNMKKMTKEEIAEEYLEQSKTKKVSRKSKDDFYQNIKDADEEAGSYDEKTQPIDGFILQPKGPYSDTPLKWKPNNTIDFLVTQDPSKFSNNIKAPKLSGDRFYILSYDSKTNINGVFQAKYVVFTSSSQGDRGIIFDGIVEISGGKHQGRNVEGEIVEFEWDIDNKSLKPMKYRYDRDYPNKLMVARSVWADIHNPLPFETLEGENLLLFRKYANIDKENCLESAFKQGDIIVDIGFGRGGDALKYSKIGIKHVFAIEPDSSNRDEFERRVKTMDISFTYTWIPIGAENTKQVLEYVKDSPYKVENITGIVAFNSLTFFMESKEKFEGVINTISELSNSGTKFVGTVLNAGIPTDGLDLLNKSKKATITQNEYLKFKLEEIKRESSNNNIVWDTPGFTITAKNLTKELYGNEILINIKEETAIVKNQTEWLFYFVALKQYLVRNGLELLYEKQLSGPIANKLPDYAREFSGMFTNFVFVKRQEKIRIATKSLLQPNEEDSINLDHLISKNIVEDDDLIKKLKRTISKNSKLSKYKHDLYFVLYTVGYNTESISRLLEKGKEDEFYEAMNLVKKFNSKIDDLDREEYKEEEESKKVKIKPLNFVYIGVEQDSSNIFHAISRAVNDKYSKMDKEKRKKYISNLRSEVAANASISELKKIDNGRVYAALKEKYGNSNKALEEFKKLIDSEEWIDKSALLLLSNHLETNIYIINSRMNIERFNDSCLSNYDKTVLLFTPDNIHYMVIGQRIGKGIRTTFDSNNIVIKNIRVQACSL